MMSPQHWARQQERGSAFFLQLTAWLVKHSPSWLLAVCARVVVAYFFITSPTQRQHIRAYQRRLRQTFPLVVLPRTLPVWRQFLAFAHAITDRFAVWQNAIHYADLRVDDADGVYEDIQLSAQQQQAGAILVCSHLGNVEICRALVNHHPKFVLNVLVYSAHARAFNQAMQSAGADGMNLIQVTDLDATLMLDLQRRLARGEWLAIAADRVPVRGEKTVSASFLGDVAEFPQGPWLMAGLLRAPLITVFCHRQQGHYNLHLRRFAAAPQWQRHTRSTVVAALAQRFANVLATECARVPLQWFNFYDFWNDDGSKTTL